jgi:hypothetical protein
MRCWLAAGGIDPTKDVDLIVVPLPQMVANMKVGNMEAIRVGEPWNEQLVNQGIGFTATTTTEIWANHPEKVLGMRADWVDANPNATIALMMAQIWCDDAANKDEMAAIVGRRQWYDVPVADISGRIKGDVNYGNGRTVSDPALAMKFWRGGAASFPWKSLDTWFITENKRWGYLPGDLDTAAVVGATNRSDLWLQAAAGLGIDTAAFGDSRGVETFFDGKTFDPANPDAYLDSLSIKAMAYGGDVMAVTALKPKPAPKPAAQVLALSVAPARPHYMARVGQFLGQSVAPPMVVLAVLLLIWQAAFSGATSGLPAPTDVWEQSRKLITSPFFFYGTQGIGLGWRVLTSLKRVAYGFGLAAVVGVLVRAVLGQSALMMRGFDPIFQVWRRVPPLAWLPISRAVFMDSGPSAIFVIFITAI